MPFDLAHIDFTSSDFEANILGQATREAVNQIVQKLQAESSTSAKRHNIQCLYKGE